MYFSTFDPTFNTGVKSPERFGFGFIGAWWFAFLFYENHLDAEYEYIEKRHQKARVSGRKCVAARCVFKWAAYKWTLDMFHC